MDETEVDLGSHPQQIVQYSRLIEKRK